MMNENESFFFVFALVSVSEKHVLSAISLHFPQLSITSHESSKSHKVFLDGFVYLGHLDYYYEALHLVMIGYLIF